MPGRRSAPPGPRLPRGGPRAKPTPPRHFSASASRTEGGGASHTSCTENHTSRKPPRPRAVSGIATKACWAFQETPPPGAGSAEWLRQPTGASARTSRGSPPLASAVLWRADHKLHFPGRDAAAKGLPGHSSARTSALPGPPRRWCPTRTAFHQRKVSCHLEPCCHAVPLVWALIMVPTCSGLCFPSALCPGWHSNCQTTHPGNS